MNNECVQLFVCPQLTSDNCDVEMYYKLDGVVHRKDVYLQNLKVNIYILHMQLQITLYRIEYICVSVHVVSEEGFIYFQLNSLDTFRFYNHLT